jgi:RNA polymerase primary sigma factor
MLMLQPVPVGQQAIDEAIVAQHDRLVHYTIRRYGLEGRGLDYADLAQEGLLGLLRATRTYNPHRGAFSTYAVLWIRQYMQRALQKQRQGDTVRNPVRVTENMGRVLRAAEELAQELRRAPSAEEIGVRAQMPTRHVHAVLEHRVRHVASLDEPLFEDGDQAKVDLLADQRPGPYEQVVVRELKDHLAAALATLTPVQATVLRLRYGLEGEDEHTQAQVAQVLGRTRTRVHQIEKEALDRLRHPMRARRLARHLAGERTNAAPRGPLAAVAAA